MRLAGWCGADLFDLVVPDFARDAHVEDVLVLRDDGAAELLRCAEVPACFERGRGEEVLHGDWRSAQTGR